MSRRIRPKPEFALQQRVEQMWEEFDYPDQDIPPVPFELDGGGGAFSVQIAASDGPDIEKQKADFISVGVSDGDVIQAAVDLLHASSAARGGRIILGSGSFNIATGSVDLGEDIILQGVGHDETRVVTTDTSGTMIATDGNCTVRDLMVSGGGGSVVGIDLGGECAVNHVAFEFCDVAIIPDNEAIITRCRCKLGVGQFVDATNIYTDLYIGHNIDVTQIALGASTQVIVIGNRMGEEITVNGGEDILIVDNIFEAVVPSVDYTIKVANANHVVIARNNLANMGGAEGIQLDTCTDSEVSGNVIESTDTGILLTGCDRINVVGGLIKWAGLHGLEIAGSSHCIVEGLRVFGASQNSTNTSDNIHLSGDSDRNLITGCQLQSAQFSFPRCAVNVSASTCDCNMVVGNDLGDPADYGTDALNDAGTDTQLTYPNDPTYGDNFTDCDTSPSSPTSP